HIFIYDSQLLHILYRFFSLLLPPPPRSTLFPYTTLFRSQRADERNVSESNADGGACRSGRSPERPRDPALPAARPTSLSRSLDIGKTASDSPGLHPPRCSTPHCRQPVATACQGHRSQFAEGIGSHH